MENRVGQQLGNYRLIKLLGYGSFADVYLGEHVYLGTNAAVKVLTTKLTDDQIARFRDEARIIRGLRHLNIVTVLEFGMEGHLPFIIMDYTPNGSLRQHHPRGTQLALTTIVSYVKQIAGALQYAHDVGLVHRDIKPDNLLLGMNNEVWLSDFGIATITNSVYQSQQDMAGTITYMAPEQIGGKPRRASDQYALGIVVYEWLSGTPPFQGTFAEVASQHISVPPPSLHEKVPELPPAVEDVVMMALAKNPQERFANVRDFAAALNNACELPDENYYPKDVAQAIRECYYQSSKTLRALGAPRQISQEGVRKKSLRGTEGYKRPFANGSIYWCERSGAHPVWWGINQLYYSLNGAEGLLGFPLTDELTADSSPQETEGVFQRFESTWDYPEDIFAVPLRYGASVYWSKRYGAHPTSGGIGICYERLGGTGGVLGFPTSPELNAGPSQRGTTGMYQHFEGGTIYWCERGHAHPIWGDIGELYQRLGGVEGRLGIPLTGELVAASSPQGTTGVFQRFESTWDYPEDITFDPPIHYGASIYWSKQYGAHETWGGIGIDYERLGGTSSVLGFPASGELEAESSPYGTTGWYQHFEGGDIHWCEKYGGVSVVGPILAVYKEFGGSVGKFGFPKSFETHATDNLDIHIQEFEGGIIAFSIGSAEKSIDIENSTR